MGNLCKTSIPKTNLSSSLELQIIAQYNKPTFIINVLKGDNKSDNKEVESKNINCENDDKETGDKNDGDNILTTVLELSTKLPIDLCKVITNYSTTIGYYLESFNNKKFTRAIEDFISSATMIEHTPLCYSKEWYSVTERRRELERVSDLIMAKLNKDISKLFNSIDVVYFIKDCNSKRSSNRHGNSNHNDKRNDGFIKDSKRSSNRHGDSRHNDRHGDSRHNDRHGDSRHNDRHGDSRHNVRHGNSRHNDRHGNTKDSDKRNDGFIKDSKHTNNEQLEKYKYSYEFNVDFFTMINNLWFDSFHTKYNKDNVTLPDQSHYPPSQELRECLTGQDIDLMKNFIRPFSDYQDFKKLVKIITLFLHCFKRVEKGKEHYQFTISVYHLIREHAILYEFVKPRH